MSNTLFLMVGLPGAGKTTTARALSEVTGAVHLWADEHRRKQFGTPKFDVQENQAVYDQLNREASEMLAHGKSVIYDTAFNHFADREKLRAIASQHGADTIIIWVQAPPSTARERATKDSHLQSTRVFGDMSNEHFDKLSQKLEPPHANEKTIIVDGTKITREYIKSLLPE